MSDKPIAIGWDAGLRFGYAVAQGNNILKCGSLDLTQRAEQTRKKPTSVLYSEMRSIVKEFNVEICCREDSVQSFKGADSNRQGRNKFGYAKQIGMHSGYFTILDLIVDAFSLREIPHVKVRTLKKFATDNGDADKLQMTRVAQRLYGIETEDDNTADACHVAMYALHEFSKKVRGLS